MALPKVGVGGGGEKLRCFRLKGGASENEREEEERQKTIDAGKCFCELRTVYFVELGS